MKKVLVITILFLAFARISFAQKNEESALQKYSRLSYKLVMNGDAVSAVCESKTMPDAKSILKCLNREKEIKSPLYTTTITYIGCSTIYDMCSNGIPQNIIQDPNNPNRIHAVCMYAPQGDGTAFPSRRTKYYYSTNKGVTWTFVSDVPNVRSGFPVVTLAANGNELISNHYGTPQMVKFAYDAGPGLGSFTYLEPSAAIDYYWPRTVTTNSITLTNKFISVSSPGGRDSCFRIAGTSFGPAPGTFTPWQFMYSEPAESYSIAKGADGRIGILYIANRVLLPNAYGDIYFMESTDNGISFGTPTKIFAANISPTGDSLGAYGGLQLVYQGNIPKAVFETVKQSTFNNYFINDGRNNIRFWSTSLPGSDPVRSIKIADTGNVGYHPLINHYSGSSDNLSCISRPTIGSSLSGNALFVAFMVPSNYVGGSVDTVSYKDIWLTISYNGGSNWVTPSKINPTDTNHLRDWSYPCLSITNDNITPSTYNINLLVLCDSLPGSYINFSANGNSLAKYMFMRITPIVGINNISQNVPGEYKLYQNYPNPFNPSTNIRYQITNNTLVALKIYDILGKEVATLVNEKQSPGTYEVTFDGSSLSSGIYFYKLETENFSDVKRCVLVK